MRTQNWIILSLFLSFCPCVLADQKENLEECKKKVVPIFKDRYDLCKDVACLEKLRDDAITQVPECKNLITEAVNKPIEADRRSRLCRQKLQTGFIDPAKNCLGMSCIDQLRTQAAAQFPECKELVNAFIFPSDSIRRLDFLPFDQTYWAGNGLLVVHYPAALSFKVKSVNRDIISLSRTNPEEIVTLASIDHPSYSTLDEFAQQTQAKSVEKLTQYTQTEKNSVTCARQPGIEYKGQWVLKNTQITFIRRDCYFLKNGHGYFTSYNYQLAPSVDAKKEESLLYKITESLDLK